MYDNTVHRDYVKTEMEYRLGRIRADIAGRRTRRALTRRNAQNRPGDAGGTASTWAD
ncbi:hypothetical protein [Nocardioides sp. YIM 152315]|uniref:hypothetical protein n=1 Tax=Nocardioides sp. YIM 152315 TaxID=3031760 RepID=UPI0023DBFB29|nr:hypothetical protein [Nocardioides sp. YIM 152315]MDF1602275.1 hypothetical protein [Nocardioides sp. YIM 152315]